jgi:hypothetical protein
MTARLMAFESGIEAQAAWVLASRPKLFGLELGCGMVVKPRLFGVWHDCQT